MPGCAEVCDKVARIFQKLKEYEMASCYFQVNFIILEACTLGALTWHLLL